MIYLDIETAAVAWEEVPPETKELWGKFARNKYRDDYSWEQADSRHASTVFSESFLEPVWNDKSSLHSEFGLIVCVSYAIDGGDIHSLTAPAPGDEVELLKRFAVGVGRNDRQNLCAHNGKGFDFPWLAQRMVIRNVKVPNILNTQGKKPWETPFVDTQELWGFGDMRRTVRLDVLCHALGVASPKDAMNGAEVPQAWRDGKIEEIREYCERDVTALREVYQILASASSDTQLSLSL